MPSIVVTPSSPSKSSSEDPPASKVVPKHKEILTDDYKRKCVDLNDGKWTKSSKGGDVFVVDGHGYLKKDMRSSSKTGKVTLYLKCMASTCPGANRLSDGLLVDKDHKGHSCLPDPTLFEKLNMDNQIKASAASSNLAPSKIINEGLYEMSEEGRISSKSVGALRHKIQRQRRKGKGKMPKSIEEIEIKPESVLLPGNLNFLLYDNKKVGHRIIIFGDYEGLLWLGNSEEWDSDGTFDAAPGTLTELFAQLYVFHGKVDGQKFPLVFCLMEKREAMDYIEILQVMHVTLMLI